MNQDQLPTADRRPALFRGKAWFWLPIAPLIALDLWSKSAAFTALAERFPLQVPEYREWKVLELDWGGFSLVEWRNRGTIWGLGQGLNLPLRILRTLAVPLLIYFAATTPARKRLQLLVLGAILAGAVGNLYDNYVEADHAVRDFLLFYAWWGGERHVFPAFNVADSCISVGAFTLLLLLWRGDAGSRS